MQGKKSDSVTDGDLKKVETANLLTKSIIPLNTEVIFFASKIKMHLLTCGISLLVTISFFA